VLSARREQARSLAEAIDRVLLRSAPADRALELARRQDATRMADRVQLRVKRLAKTQATQRSHILTAADTLILRLYRAAVPAGWQCGWCDATVTRDGSLRYAGVGAVILNDRGREVARLSEPIAECEPFEAEIAALEAALQAAAGHGGRARRIRVYTDCGALVSLWLQRRRDPRLSTVRLMASRLRRFELRHVPRRHNQIAHRLARKAAARLRQAGSPA
jgi:ribonuclease HI